MWHWRAVTETPYPREEDGGLVHKTPMMQTNAERRRRGRTHIHILVVDGADLSRGDVMAVIISGEMCIRCN